MRIQTCKKVNMFYPWNDKKIYLEFWNGNIIFSMGKMKGLSSQVHMKLWIYTFFGHKNILITGYGSVI